MQGQPPTSFHTADRLHPLTPEKYSRDHLTLHRELDVVTLTHDLQEHGLTKGSKGTVVHCYGNDQRFEVEFVSEVGDTIALLTLERADLQLERETIREQVLAILNSLPDDLIAEVRDFAEFLQRRKAG